MKDSLERLVCFDRAFAAPAQSAAPAPAAAPVAPVTATPPVPAVAATPAASEAFGDEQVKRPVKELKVKAGPENLQATVASLKEMRKGLFRITLDNEQVWEQGETTSLFRVDVGDTVRIERGALGSYRMARVADNGRAGGWVQVNRLK
jgi:hypothetical protein